MFNTELSDKFLSLCLNFTPSCASILSLCRNAINLTMGNIMKVGRYSDHLENH